MHAWPYILSIYRNHDNYIHCLRACVSMQGDILRLECRYNTTDRSTVTLVSIYTHYTLTLGAIIYATLYKWPHRCTKNIGCEDLILLSEAFFLSTRT